MKPPVINLFVPVSLHPNIFDRFICIDFLKDKKVKSVYSDGWVPVYTIHSILMQLQSFLNEPLIHDIDEKLNKKIFKDNVRQANAFKCS